MIFIDSDGALLGKISCFLFWAAFASLHSAKTGFAWFANAHRPRRYAPAVDGFAATPIPAASSHKDVRPTIKC